MYCPQCGQEQISGETRFCSRCGFPLGGVMALLASGGVPAITEAAASPKKLSPRRRGYRQGVILMLISVILTPVLGILTDIGFPEVFVALAAVIFWVGIIRMVYARIFQEATVQGTPDTLPSYVPPAAPMQFNASARQSALPPQRGVPLTDWRQRANTSEIVPPPSVTENTTRLLDDKAETPRR